MAGNITVNRPVYVQKGKIVCDGDLNVNSDGLIEMTDDEASILVYGNFNARTSSSISRPLNVNFTAGTFELKGNFTDEELKKDL